MNMNMNMNMNAIDTAKTLVKATIPDRILFIVSPHTIKIYSQAMSWYVADRHYVSSIDPFELIFVDPNSIDRKMSKSSKARFNFSNVVSEVVDGSWDKRLHPISESVYFRSMVDHFCHGVQWNDTPIFNRLCRRIDEGNVVWECSTISELEERLNEIDQLFENIKNDGYLTQEALENIPGQPAEQRKHRYLPPRLNEVIVNIGRDGEIIFHDGRHRLFISKILEIDQIPVRVKSRHTRWQNIRDSSLKAQSIPEKYRGHPDLAHDSLN